MTVRPTIEELRSELEVAARLTDDVTRTLTVLAIITVALEEQRQRPVLVGGMAVLYWTEFPDFATTDIDVVLEHLPSVSAALSELGFVRGDERHWVLPGSSVLLEAPEGQMIPGATVRRVEVARDRYADVLSLVDVAIVRLEEFQATGHPVAGHQALVLLGHVGGDEMPRLKERAEVARVVGVLQRLLMVAEDVAAGRCEVPQAYEFHEIADAARAAEYPGA